MLEESLSILGRWKGSFWTYKELSVPRTLEINASETDLCTNTPAIQNAGKNVQRNTCLYLYQGVNNSFYFEIKQIYDLRKK